MPAKKGKSSGSGAREKAPLFPKKSGKVPVLPKKPGKSGGSGGKKSGG